MCLKSWLILALVISLLVASECSWGAQGDSQYHIQTDEGPDRYFRFQTDNGQFRKERRLQDGTVVGTEAWIDAAGFLRQKDYIADKNGYRILKSKTVFVGNGRHIEDAIKSTKQMSAKSGVFADGRGGLRPNINSIDDVEKSRQNGYMYPQNVAPLFKSASIVNLNQAAEAYDGKLNYLSTSESNSTSISNSIADYAEVPPLPSLTMQPPSRSGSRQRIRPIAVYDVAPLVPISSAEAAPTPFTSANIGLPAANGYYYPTSSTHLDDVLKSFEINQLDGGLLPPLPSSTHRQQRLPTTGSMTLPASYDGVSKGFHYFLPRQYHEEEQFGNEKRAGSFGYVDPFGIRRVVYYNASPGRGLVHRNNNLYVGLRGTPYDAAA